MSMLKDFNKNYNSCDCIGHTLDGDISLKYCKCKKCCNKFCRKRDYHKIYKSNITDIEIILFILYKKERDKLRKNYFKNIKIKKYNKINLKKFKNITKNYYNNLYILQKKYFGYSDIKLFL